MSVNANPWSQFMSDNPVQKQFEKASADSDHGGLSTGASRFPPIADQAEINGHSGGSISPRLRFYLARTVGTAFAKRQ